MRNATKATWRLPIEFFTKSDSSFCGGRVENLHYSKGINDCDLSTCKNLKGCFHFLLISTVEEVPMRHTDTAIREQILSFSLMDASS